MFPKCSMTHFYHVLTSRTCRRKLGNKTKMIKLMSNVGSYGLIILTPPLNPNFMIKYQKNIGPRSKV